MKVNKKTEKKEGLNNSAEPIQMTEQPIQQNSLDEDFALFERSTSEYTPDTDDEIIQPENDKVVNDISNSISLKIKTKMFVGLCCMILAGFNTYLFNKMKNTKVPISKMILDDEEQESIMIYLDDPKFVEFIDKIPSWIIGIIHVEYLFYNKHNEVSDEYKIETKPKLKKV